MLAVLLFILAAHLSLLTPPAYLPQLTSLLPTSSAHFFCSLSSCLLSLCLFQLLIFHLLTPSSHLPQLTSLLLFSSVYFLPSYPFAHVAPARLPPTHSLLLTSLFSFLLLTVRLLLPSVRLSPAHYFAYLTQTHQPTTHFPCSLSYCLFYFCLFHLLIFLPVTPLLICLQLTSLLRTSPAHFPTVRYPPPCCSCAYSTWSPFSCSHSAYMSQTQQATTHYPCSLSLVWFPSVIFLLLTVLLLIPPARISHAHTSCLPASYSPVYYSLTVLFHTANCPSAYSACSSFSCSHPCLHASTHQYITHFLAHFPSVYYPPSCSPSPYPTC